MIGERLGPYLIEELLGEGGMGVVYRAHDTLLKRPVAIKVIAPHAAGDAVARARLLREARTASAVNHPHVCTIHTVRALGDQLFIVMEDVAGKTLRVLSQPAGVPIGDCVRYGVQIADALECAHQHGVVHRDLKTANVIVTPRSGVKVLDFGLAKHFGPAADDDETQLSMTSPDVLIGTVPYMAPELFRGASATPATDVWALGVVLYEMATGCLPFTGDSVMEVASAIIEKSPSPLPLKLPDVIEATIRRCLTKDPDARWATAGEVRLALEMTQSKVTWTSKDARRSPPGTAAPRKHRIKSLAVLPLENLSADSSQEFLADGLTEALITTMAKVSALRVISRTSVMRYKGSRIALPQIAKELKVDAVIQGSVIALALRSVFQPSWYTRARIPISGPKLYDRQFSDVLAIQSEIAQAIVDQIQITLSQDERSDIARARRVNVAAYEDYLRGRYHWNRRTGDELRRAMEYFDRAIASDPNVPLPYAGLADCYLSLVSYGVIAPNDGMPRAKQIVAKALELEPTLVPALCSAAMMFFAYDWQPVLAEQYFHRAVKLNPSYPIAHQWYSLLLTACGRSDEALGALAKARDLDPLSLAVTTHTAWALYFRGDYADALRHCSHALELQPEFYQALVLRGMVHVRIGMVVEAVTDLEKAVAVAGRDETGIITLAYAYAASGRSNRAHRILDRVTTQQGRYCSAYPVAAVYVAAGELDEAWKWLERAYQERNWYMPMLGVDPRFDALRGDLRFAELVQRIGTFSPAPTS